MADNASKKDVSRLRSEIRSVVKLLEDKNVSKIAQPETAKPFSGGVTGNYWTQTGAPWVSDEARKAVLTEWFWQPIRGQPRRVDTNELRQFSQTFWVNSCVTVLSDEITSMDWDIVPKEDFNYESVKDKIIERKEFLKHPNKNRESFTIVVRAALKDILELDAGVLVKVFTRESYDFDNVEPKSGSPMLKEKGQREMVEIYARDGASFLAETDKFGFVTGYWQYSYQIPAHPMWFNKDEICYLKRNHRSMSPYGYAPTQAIMDLIKSLHYSTLYNKRFFEETAIPDGILSMLNTSKEELTNFVSEWTGSFRAQPHRMAAVNQETKWIPLTAMQRELEFLETQSWYYKLIIAMFGLTPAELGLTEDVNRATAATQAELSRRKGIRPLLKLLEDYINEDIMSEWGDEGIMFQFIYDDPTEKNQRLMNAELELNLGLKSINEIRDEWGLAPVDWGEGQFSRFGPGQGQGNQFGEDGKTNGEDENREREEGKINVRKIAGDVAAITPKDPGKRIESVIRRIPQTLADPQRIAESARTDPDILEMWERLADDFNEGILNMDELSERMEEIKTEEDNIVAMRGKAEKGMDDGQYYHEPLQVSKPNKGKIVQPQNKVKKNVKNMTVCPYCGHPSLSQESNPDIPNSDDNPRFRCAYCHGYFMMQDLLDQQALERLEELMTGNPSTKPVNIPSWSPKSFDFDKESSMLAKEFVRFDYSKSNDEIMEYVMSKKYHLLLKKYLSDLADQKIERIKQMLIMGIQENQSITKVADNINKVVDDKRRSNMIARTEILRIINRGHINTLKKRDVKRVIWLAAHDERTCPICKKLNGKVYKMGKVPEIPAHPQCRCTVSEYVEV